ncbi:SLC13 family permease [Caldisphaera lagunensis]|nr:SLC13 family permease [Caldisphaera lagunensis]
MPSLHEYGLIAIIIISLSFLLSRRLRHDIIGIATMIVLIIAGYLTPQEALQNFSSITVIMLISLMIIAGTLADSGILEVMGNYITSKIKYEKVLLLLLLSLTVIASGFVSDVALILAFIPLIYSVSLRLKRPISRYLLPLAYAAILGGPTTLIGTSTNVILTNAWYNKFGYNLNLFEFAKINLIASFISIIILVFVITPFLGRKIKEVSSLKEITVQSYIIEAQITGDSNFIGKTPKDVEKSLNAKVIRIISPWRFIGTVRKLKEGDILLLKITPAQLPLILSSRGLKISEKEKEEKEMFFELLVTSSSKLKGRKVKELDLDTYNSYVIGIASANFITRINDYILRPGDILLIQGEEPNVAKLAKYYDLLPINSQGLKAFDKRKALFSISGLSIAIILSFFNFNLGLSFLIGALISTFSGFSTLRKMYEYVEWPLIVFIGSYLSLGEVIINSGISSMVGGLIHSSLLILFLLAILLSNTVGYVTAAIILAPIALSFPNPLLGVTVLAMGASSPFLTPFAHQANLIAYGTAGYKNRDFLLAGILIILIKFLVTFYLLGLLKL